MNTLGRVFAAWAAFIACLTSTVLAQEATTTVMGSVVDSVNQPMSGVLVFVDEGPGSAMTGAVGAFRLEGVSEGTHLLNLRKAGFAPRTFNLVFAPNEDRRDVGVIMLEEGPDPTATLTGRVVEGRSGTPVVGAEVELNGDLLAVSGDDGRFHIPRVPITWGRNHLSVGSLSYADVTAELWIVDPDETLELSVTLDPLPIELGGIVAEVARPPGVPVKMERFYQRRERPFGDFLTGPEIIEWNPSQFTDLLIHVPGVRLSGGRIRFSRAAVSPGGFGGCRSPLIFYDGLLIGGDDDYVDLDQRVNVDNLAGVEFYNGVARVPAEFNTTGSACGVIALWTR